jgi:hypothetical protein
LDTGHNGVIAESIPALIKTTKTMWDGNF